MSNNITTQKTCNREYTLLSFLLLPLVGILFEVMRIGWNVHIEETKNNQVMMIKQKELLTLIVGILGPYFTKY